MNRIISDLTPLFDDPSRNKFVVLGGDLNITTQWTGRNAKQLRRDALTSATPGGDGSR